MVFLDHGFARIQANFTDFVVNKKPFAVMRGAFLWFSFSCELLRCRRGRGFTTQFGAGAALRLVRELFGGHGVGGGFVLGEVGLQDFGLGFANFGD